MAGIFNIKMQKAKTKLTLRIVEVWDKNLYLVDTLLTINSGISFIFLLFIYSIFLLNFSLFISVERKLQAKFIFKAEFKKLFSVRQAEK